MIKRLRSIRVVIRFIKLRGLVAFMSDLKLARKEMAKASKKVRLMEAGTI
jgi:hypothetical protein